MGFLVLSAFGLAAAVAVVVLGRRLRATVRTAVAAVLLAAAIWAAGVALMLTGWKDIDGWIDCHPHCHGWHRLGGAIFWFPPALVAALLLVTLAAVATARRR